MYSIKDRLIDWVNQKGAWTHILLAAGIALLITVIILAAAMPSRGAVNANKVDIGEVQTTIGTVVNGLTTKASQAELNSWGQNITQALSIQAVDIIGLRTKWEAAEDELKDNTNDIATIQNSLADLSSPPGAYLTGTFKSYVLHAKSSEAGNFTASVYLVYSPPVSVGNTTYDDALATFYGSINWTAPAIKNYVPVLTYNSTTWQVTQVWFNIGAFAMEGNSVTALPIVFSGLNNTYIPSFAYVEVWPVR